MKIGSMFSGYGGLDLAVEQATGATPAWFCEWDDAPSKILAHHWPDVPNFRDVTTVDWGQVPKVDIITGGSPCQDLSTAGRRAGMTEGTRSNLWVHMREAISAIKPRLVVWENVMGALSAKATSESDLEQQAGLLGDGSGGHLRALGRVLGDLAEIGYDAQWTTLRASDIGAPHHRARVFLVAFPTHAEDERLSGQQQPVGGCSERAVTDSCVRTLPAGISCFPTPAASDWKRSEESPADSKRKSPGIAAVSIYFPTPNTMEYLPVREGEARERQLHRGDMSSSRRSSMGNLREDIVHGTDGVSFGKYAPAVERWERVRGVSAPPPTELNTKGKPRLNAAFAEWMMGLPAGWVTDVPGLTRQQQLKAIGNGVCPPQATAALTQLLKEK